MTVGAYRRQMLFEDEALAEIVRDVWNGIPNHFAHADVDEFVVMPNHVHGIIWITKSTVGAIVGSFKSAATKRANMLRGMPGAKLWQRNYYEHVIRGEDELRTVREYISTNPLKWQLDRENPRHVPNSDHERDWGWLEGVADVA